MNRSAHPKLIMRTPPDVNAWLKSRASDNGRSITAEFIQIMRTMMCAEPLFAVVRHCRFGDEEFFTAAIGESTDDFYQGPSKEEAFVAARAKLKELGFERAAIEFRTETDKENE